MSSAAERQREHRRREASGRILLTVEVDEIEVTEVLRAARLLNPMLEHSREDIALAVERLIKLLAEE